MNRPDSIPDSPFSPVHYERRLIAFFDVLGWRSAIDQAADDPALIGRLAFLLRLFTAAFVPREERHSGARLSSFSDNVVVTFPLESEQIPYRLRNIALIQAGVAIIGFSLRGAVTIGPIHHDEHIVFGPALNRAYELESGTAHYPRILLDNAVPEFRGLEHELIVNEGDLQFLDPFTPAYLDANGPGDRVERRFETFNSYFGEKLAPPSERWSGALALHAILGHLSQAIGTADRLRTWGQIAWQFDRIAERLGIATRALDLPTRVTPHPRTATLAES